MDKKTAGHSEAMKAKMAPKHFTKNPIPGTKFTIAVSSAKGGVGKSTFAANLSKREWNELMESFGFTEKII